MNDEPTHNVDHQGSDIRGRNLRRPIQPYTCRYCGWVTTVPSEAEARLCVRCVRFDGDVHPAMTGARIAAHNARIMGMIKTINRGKAQLIALSGSGGTSTVGNANS